MDLEQSFIGGLIINGSQVPEVRTILPNGSFLQDSICAQFYDAILATYDHNNSVDIVLVKEEAEKRKLDIVELIEWEDCYDVDGYVKVLIYAKKIAENYMKRIGSQAIIQLHTDFEENPDPFESIDQAITNLSHLRSQFKKDQTVSMETVAKEACEEIESIRSGAGSFSLPFGFVDIDNITGGMEKGDLIVIAGLPKRGKTTLMLQTIFNNAIKGKPCLIFSTEMRRKQILFRYALIVEKISWIKVKNNHLTELEWERLLRRVNILGTYPIYIRDSVLTIADIYSDSERFIEDHGVKLVAVDYIQRIVPISKKSNENREREVAAISSGLKNIAIQFDVPLIALSQLNEDLHARESRAIEADMDKMITINHEDKDEITPDGSGSVIGIKIWQRMGMSGGFGDSKLYYDRLSGSWRSYSEEIPDERSNQTEVPF